MKYHLRYATQVQSVDASVHELTISTCIGTVMDNTATNKNEQRLISKDL
jgi:hypothetical protein